MSVQLMAGRLRHPSASRSNMPFNRSRA
jgi:hypothetical protein